MKGVEVFLLQTENIFLLFQVYAVCTSVKEPCTRIPRMTGEEKEFEVIERGQSPVYIKKHSGGQRKFSIRFSPERNTWPTAGR